jgi:hypothetical protein
MFRNEFCAPFALMDGWGSFIPHPAPTADGLDPGQEVGAKFGPVRQHRNTNTQNRVWNAIAQRINAYPYPVSDQCSEKHYWDVFEFLRGNVGVVDRVAECGTFEGGLSVLLAGCAVAFDFRLDLIEVVPARMAATYHRIRMTFPEALDRVNLFFGEVPNYVKAVRDDPTFRNAVLHHDGSHIFQTVTRDLASLSFVKDRVHAVLIQDTHLRKTDPDQCWFVDAAVTAVFGHDPHYQPLGVTFPETTAPDDNGIYFVGGRPEGMLLPIELNTFLYPHPGQTLDALIAYPAR